MLQSRPEVFQEPGHPPRTLHAMESSEGAPEDTVHGNGARNALRSHTRPEAAMIPIPFRRRVSWAEMNKLYLIGNRSELAELKGELWYNKANFKAFRDEAVEELKAYMRQHGITDSDVALQTIYQPNELLPTLEEWSDDSSDL